ncbi:class I SAM-dependent methyltransferase [Pyrococcus furiosus DSM 3638]|uniref:Methyltransferase n=3 Tax=Pyrococcus furiosus TaxID=2261 RepID=Q8U2W1_PYRFU|nr:class I SAM-dependent methyltransferase [Pyrococcus furiosus]AAL80841.1 putative methyltransferase [Pyrococcus furiosus DSM 3638]AFN03505.1 methyltransferase [Pyrococcus furiosus COM1]QEK78404.1 class I SAM-dependent methyltransferase [Pyrococcus furiosus DSM 3638]
MYYLHNEFRKKIQPIEPLVELIRERIPKRDILVDFGAGTGYFTLPLAKLFREVYAIDINAERLEYLRKRLKEEGITNVKLILGDKLPDVKADLILLSNVIHELPEPEKFLREVAERADYVLVLDWRKTSTPWGPPLEERISEEEARKMMEEYFIVEVFNLYPYHYCLLGTRRFR